MTRPDNYDDDDRLYEALRRSFGDEAAPGLMDAICDVIRRDIDADLKKMNW